MKEKILNDAKKEFEKKIEKLEHYKEFEELFEKIKKSLEEFREMKVWRGDNPKKYTKFLLCLVNICLTLDLPIPVLKYNPSLNSFGCFGEESGIPTITINKFSVVTFFHELLHYLDKMLMLGFTHKEVFYFSIELYRRIFPVSYSNCQLVFQNGLPFVFKGGER